MKEILKNALLLLNGLFILTTFSCEKENMMEKAQSGSAIDVKTYGDLEFIYQVTDMEGDPSATFKKGENFILSFVVKNHREEDVSLGRWDFPAAIDDFFAVYKKSNEENRDVLIGKSFKPGVNFRDLKPQIVPGKGRIEYSIPWLTDNNTNYIMPTYEPEKKALKRNYISIDPLPLPLTPGRYYSGFTLEYQNKEISFEISFTIE